MTGRLSSGGVLIEYRAVAIAEITDGHVEHDHGSANNPTGYSRPTSIFDPTAATDSPWAQASATRAPST